MNDIKRSILWIVFGFSMVLLWDKWQVHNGGVPLFFPNPAAVSGKAATPAGASAAPEAGAALTTGAVPTSSANLSAKTAAAEALAPTDGAPAPARELIEVSTDVFKLSFDPVGATLVRAELLKQNDIVNPDTKMVLLEQSKDRFYDAESGLIGAPNLPNHKSKMTLVSPERALKEGADTLLLRFEAEGGGAKFSKTYELRRGSYAIGVTHEVTNVGDESLKPQLYLQILRDGNKPAGESSFYSTFTGPVVYTDAKKYQKIDFAQIDKKTEEFEKSALGGYVGMVQHYFVSAWLAPSGEMHENFARKISANLYAVGMILSFQPIAPSQTQTLKANLYVGPQEEDQLAALAPGLELVKDYGYFTILSKPLFWLIVQLHKALGNWGWAIVAVVFLLKAVFYWLNAKAYQSMGKMKAINPKIMEMRERLKDKPQEMQKEMMRIYKEEKVNPMGGCLPIIIQIPVFIALYWVLLSSVEFRGAPWILWIHDLSKPDPLYILPLLMMASSLLQTWLNPTPPDPVQAKMMWIMPVAFSFMFFFFPAGLVLYWLTNNILSIAQQWVINKRLGVN